MYLPYKIKILLDRTIAGIVKKASWCEGVDRTMKLKFVPCVVHSYSYWSQWHVRLYLNDVHVDGYWISLN